MGRRCRVGFRSWLAGCALLIATSLSTVMAGDARFKLRELYPQEKVAKVLIPRQQWHPWPRWSERKAWGALPEPVRKDLIANGEQHLRKSWPDLPATLFLEYAREGNRSRYEHEHFARRTALTDLIVAECVEGKGRFLDDIANGVWAICEESFWGVPAHVGAQKAGSGLPDPAEPIVDLFAAETGESLAWTHHLLGEQLDRVSPMIRKRIAYEIERRILTPCLERDDFGWMGFSGGRVNNWNPWCNSNWLACTLLIEPDESRRIAAVGKIVRSLDHFLDAYDDDGGCDEGPGYWSRAGGSLFDCLELLHSATNGAIDVYDRPLVKEIGRYIYRVHIADDYFVNFADASAKASPPGELLYRYGNRTGDDKLAAFGAYTFARNRDEGFAGRGGYTVGRYLPEIFHASELARIPGRAALVRDVWLSGIQVMVARCKEGTADGFFVAAKGGHNAESHNHNDVGNFIVYRDGRPILIDVGVETYSRKTFSSRRYEIWTMQSAYHNLPTINGVMQSPGRQFAAKNVNHEADDDHALLRLDLAGAYAGEAGLKSWTRTVQLHRGSDIVVTEDYALERPAGEITLSLMTPCEVRVEKEGRLLLTTADTSEPRTAVRVLFNEARLKAVVEAIPVEDGRLRSVWGGQLTRILLKAEKPAMKDTWTLRIEPAKEEDR
ncbi:MAG: heparinase II/III family protein [Sedimentisphaerales bacterium]|nr:heparinase II/III family protein [Sedimentisphaerales bacterium]